MKEQINLYQFGGKNVRVVVDDGKVIEGFVRTYDSAIDNDEGVQGIAIDTGLTGTLTYLFENEIISIEVID